MPNRSRREIPHSPPAYYPSNASTPVERARLPGGPRQKTRSREREIVNADKLLVAARPQNRTNLPSRRPTYRDPAASGFKQSATSSPRSKPAMFAPARRWTSSNDAAEYHA